jgi:Ca2+-binding EF-hand superfamily protein
MDIYQINTRSKFQAISELKMNQNDNSLQECLKMLSNKIDEKFSKVASAFRFFDIRSTGFISFADFSFIID